MSTDPHAGQPVRTLGPPLEEAEAAVVLLHGRGDSAAGILGFARVLAQPGAPPQTQPALGSIQESGVAFLAPNAAGQTWYPRSFLAPLPLNEPYLSSALAAVGRVAERAAEAVGWERTVLMGFSQGACLASEFVCRNGRRYGGLVALSGGLIGNGERPGVDPPADKTFEYDGTLAGTPAFVGCSDVDPHIPVERVRRTAEVLEGLGAEVDLRIYAGMGHTVNDDEVAAVRALLTAVGQ